MNLCSYNSKTRNERHVMPVHHGFFVLFQFFEDFVGYSLNSVVYKGNGFSEADLVTRASEHLEKLKYIDALYFKDYFAEHEFPKV